MNKPIVASAALAGIISTVATWGTTAVTIGAVVLSTPLFCGIVTILAGLTMWAVQALRSRGQLALTNDQPDKEIWAEVPPARGPPEAGEAKQGAAEA